MFWESWATSLNSPEKRDLCIQCFAVRQHFSTRRGIPLGQALNIREKLTFPGTGGAHHADHLTGEKGDPHGFRTPVFIEPGPNDQVIHTAMDLVPTLLHLCNKFQKLGGQRFMVQSRIGTNGPGKGFQ